jgi:predicted transcriptional regulator
MQQLSRQEEQVMLIIWQTGGGFIRDFIGKLDNPPVYTTIASIVKNLERKGLVASMKMANSYWYQPILTLENYVRQHFSQIVKNYFSDSYQEMVSFLAREGKISHQELKEIMTMIEHKK